MAITSVVPYVDKDEYSRYELARSVVTLKVQATSDSAGVAWVTVDMLKARRDRDASIFNQVIPFTFNSAGTTVEEVVTIDLKLLMETGNELREASKITAPFNKAHRGMYFIKATASDDGGEPVVPAVSEETDEFRLSIMTLENFRNLYLFGLELSAFETRQVKYPPSQITGIEISELSRQHDIGIFPLTYNYMDDGGGVPSRTLSWMDGPVVPIHGAGNVVVPSKKQDNFIVVQVKTVSLLPTKHIPEDLIIDKDTMSEDTLRQQIEYAIGWLEEIVLQGQLEPTHIVSDAAGLLENYFSKDYDRFGSPLTLYPRISGQWIDLHFPFNNILMVNKMIGAINRLKVLQVEPDWVEITEKSGFVQLVPFSKEYHFQFLGLTFSDTLRGSVAIPNFWHYDIWTGLRDIPGDLLEAIGKKAAIEIMTVAGQAFRSVLSGQNVGRDGVYESVSYFNAGKGLLGAVIQQYQEFLTATEQRYRDRHRGPNLMVM